MDQVSGTVIALTMEPDTTDPITYGGSFAQSLVNASNNELWNGAAGNRYLMAADETDFPIYRLLQDYPRTVIEPFLADEIRLVSPVSYAVAGDQVAATGRFVGLQNTNTAIATFTWDADLFDYVTYGQPAGSTLVDYTLDEVNGSLKVVLMANEGYAMSDLGTVFLTAKDDVSTAETALGLDVQYIGFEDADKIEKELGTSLPIVTVAAGTGDLDLDNITLIDLSNVIDYMGYNTASADWYALYVYYDFNKNSEIDISDIAYLAKLIK